MSINKLALIRYKTIDNCLQNRFRKWTLEDLIEACSEALYEYEGITNGVSRRTIQLDIQNMRSEKLGYNAPIIVTDKKFYSYEDKGYSITNTPITKQDLGTLNEVLHILKQFSGFNYFQELNGMVTRLEDKLYKQKNKGRSFIDFEKNELLKGLNYISPLHKAIIDKQVINITYKSFKSRQNSVIPFCPYLLKEYRNRWFLLGQNRSIKNTLLLALDRIVSFEPNKTQKFVKPEFDVRTYFDDVIGVTKDLKSTPIKVVFKIDSYSAQYIITKPLHSSQTLLEQTDKAYIFSIEVVRNFELERELLGFGEQLTVLSPNNLKRALRSRLRKTLLNYEGIEGMEGGKRKAEG